MSNIKSALMIIQLFWGGLGQTVGFLVAEKSMFFFFFYPDIRQNSKLEKINGEEEFEREKDDHNP